MNLVLIGGGGHCIALLDVIRCEGIFNPIGVVERLNSDHSKRRNLPIIGFDDDLPTLIKKNQFAFVAIGQIKSPKARIEAFDRLLHLGAHIPVITSPHSYVAKDVNIGRGSVVMHGVVIESGTRVGMNSIINSKALLSHGSIVGDHTHISTGVICNGDVVIGSRTFIGSGSIIYEGVKVGDDCVIPAGSVLRHDISSGKSSRRR